MNNNNNETTTTTDDDDVNEIRFDSHEAAEAEAEARIAEDDQHWVVAYVNDGSDGYWIIEVDENFEENYEI